MSLLRALVVCYVKGLDGSVEILGDYLQEQALPAVEAGETPAERLEEIWVRLLAPARFELLACELVEHVLSDYESYRPNDLRCRKAVANLRRWIATGKKEELPWTNESSASAAWWELRQAFYRPDERSSKAPDEAASRAASAAWAAMLLQSGYLIEATRAARGPRPQELEWQIEQTEAVIAQDYPAAHSMDTTWFAVDKHGQVGVFYSGENGSVPQDRPFGEEPLLHDVDCDYLLPDDVLRQIMTREAPLSGEDLLGVLTQVLAAGGVPFYADDLLQNPDRKLYVREQTSRWPNKLHRSERRVTAEELERGFNQWLFQCLLWLGNEQEIWDLAQTTTWYFRLPAGEGVLAYCELLDSQVLQQLLAEGRALRAWLGFAEVIARFGLYEFHDAFDWGAGMPYACRQAPPRPVRVEQLPTVVRRSVEAVRLATANFARDALIQPCEHIACYTYGRAEWIDSHGLWRPPQADPRR